MTKNELLSYLQFLHGLCKDCQTNPSKYEMLFNAISYLAGEIENSDTDSEKFRYLIINEWGDKTYLSLSESNKKLLNLLTDKLNISNDTEIIPLDEIEYEQL